MEAKHALFMFDSCFSGTVFKQRAMAPEPRHITRATALAVRQFITAGSAGEVVPAQSVFTPAFVDSLNYGWGDLNGDGYISGVELGLYLQAKVPEHAQQTPQFGKIRDYELSRGDFVFRLRENSPSLLVGHLKVAVNAADAEVYVDGERVGMAQLQQPLRIDDLSAGEHWVRVEAAGYDSWERKVEIRTDVLTQKVVQLGRLDRRKILTVRSNVREDKVFINGTDMGSTRLDVPLEPGRYVVRVEKEGFGPFEKTLDLSKDAVLWATLNPPREVIPPAPNVAVVVPPVVPKEPDTPAPSVRTGPVRVVLLPPNTRNLCGECDTEGEVSAVAGSLFRDRSDLKLSHTYQGARLDAVDLPFASDYWTGNAVSNVPNEDAVYRVGNSTKADAALMYIYESVLTNGAWSGGRGRVHIYLFDLRDKAVHHREGTRNEMRKKTEEVMEDYLSSTVDEMGIEGIARDAGSQ
jgi:hypothetical protein